MPLAEKDEMVHKHLNLQNCSKTIRKLKTETNLVVIGDVCLCQYTSHGHCGLTEDENDNNLKILNDESLEYLCKVAVSQAEAGADIVAPSDMMMVK